MRLIGNGRQMSAIGAGTAAVLAAVLAAPAAAQTTVVGGAAATKQAQQVARPAVTPGPTDWPSYLRNPQHSSAAFTVPGITTANANSLTPRWTWVVPTVSGRSNGLTASPTVVGNTVYIGSGSGIFYALDTATGHVKWSHTLDTLSPKQAGGCGQSGIDSTATVANAPGPGALTVYVAGARYLYALDATTGAQKWRNLVGPAGSLNTTGYRNWSSPVVIGGKVLMGLSANCDTPLIRGGVQAFNQATGALQASYFDVPAGKIGGSVWSTVASDGKSVWVTTGNPNPLGTQVYDTYSIVRLSLANLKKIEKSTISLPLTADKDFGSSPTLFAATLGGTATEMVGACNKNGFYYAWRANDLAAGPYWSDQVGATSAEPNMCINSAAWDFQHQLLYIAANGTTINGVATHAAVRQVNPATGKYGWQTPLPCVPLVSPSLNGSSGLLAVSTWCNSGTSRTYLLNTSNGAVVASYAQPNVSFEQPVWAGNTLYFGGGPFSGGTLIALQ
jgi:outer membrane protein assembly factor BamB